MIHREISQPWSSRTADDRDDDEGLLRRCRDFVSRRWREVGATTAVVLVVVLLALQLVPPRFAAHADILLDPRRDKAFGQDDVASLVNLDAATVAALCRKRTKV